MSHFTFDILFNTCCYHKTWTLLAHIKIIKFVHYVISCYWIVTPLPMAPILLEGQVSVLPHTAYFLRTGHCPTDVVTRMAWICYIWGISSCYHLFSWIMKRICTQDFSPDSLCWPVWTSLYWCCQNTSAEELCITQVVFRI